MKIAHRASDRFEEFCKKKANELTMNRAHVCINTNILTICWNKCQEAALLFLDLCAEEKLIDPNLGAMALAIQKQAYLQIFLYALFLGSSEMGLKGALKRLLPILQKELFEAFAQNDANRQPGTSMLSIGPTPRGQSLNSVVAKQKLGPSNALYLPGPQLHQAVSRQMPDDCQKLLVAPNEDNVIHRAEHRCPRQECARDSPSADPREEQLVPTLPETLQVPKPRLRVARWEKIPEKVHIIEVAIQQRRDLKAMGKVAQRKVTEENDGLRGYYTEDDDMEGEKGYNYYERKKAEKKKRQQKRANGEEMEMESDSEDDGSKGEPVAAFTIDPETGEQIQLGRAVEAEAGASGLIALADPPIPHSEKTKSERMEIPVDELLSWDIEEGKVVEPTGPSEHQVHISELVKPGTQSKLVPIKGHGQGRGYGCYRK